MRKTAVALAMFLLLAQLYVVVPVAHAGDSGTLYSFNMVGPNVCEAESDIGPYVKKGDTWCVRGSGTFNTATGAVSGGGSCRHYRAGEVYGWGTWVATEFVSFESYGGPRPGHQGGFLVFYSTLDTTKGQFFVELRVSCTINAPPGAPVEGVTFWAHPDSPLGHNPVFGKVVSGRTLFHL